MSHADRVRRFLSHPVTLIVGIVLAFVIGLSMGGGGDEPEPASETVAESRTSDAPQMYTCSMHPSVRLPDPDAKCPICFMDLIPVQEGAGGPGSERQLQLDENAVARANIETTRVERFFPQAEVRLYGKVTPDETRVARLTAWFPGRIERLFVNYVGVPVGRGEHVAEIYSPELLSAVAELREAARSAQGADSMSSLVRESTRDVLVAARQRLRLLGIDERTIAAAERGEYDSERFTITAPLDGVVTHLAVRDGDYVDTGAPIATVADLSRLWIDLEAYESQLPMLRWGQRVTFTVEAHPGEVFEGRIAFVEPLVDERMRTAAVRIAVENEDGRLKPGMFASATVRTRVDANGAVVSDELAGRWVAPMHPTIVKDGPGTCEICGMDLVRAESLGVVSSSEGVTAPLVIPRSAVMYTGERSVVYVRLPGEKMPTFEVREVWIGPRAGDFVAVREGLSEGEQVVTQGAFRLDSDMQIAAKPSMMMPAAEADQMQPPVPDAFVTSLDAVYTEYLAWQTALADDDVDAARAAATALTASLDGVRSAVLTGEALGDWRRLRKDLAVDASDASIDDLRRDFEHVSRAVIALEERFGHHLDAALVRAYCPMAFGNTGAQWIQQGTTIDNPYFGASMPRCGEVREELGGHDHE